MSTHVQDMCKYEYTSDNTHKNSATNVVIRCTITKGSAKTHNMYNNTCMTYLWAIYPNNENAVFGPLRLQELKWYETTIS